MLTLHGLRAQVFQVVQKVGLCICVYDILSASDGLIGHGTGIVNVNGTTCLAESYPNKF